jgi:hypothetical protein
MMRSRGTAVIHHMDPIPKVEDSTVYGYRPTIHRVQDDRGDKLLAALLRPVVSAAA